MARLWGYRIGGALLAWLAAALAGTDVGLLLAGPEADGFDALGAALWGGLWGAAIGLAASIPLALAP
ncbi:MAG TPA: hypothetical protein VJ874_05560, partial [Candidatus Thermoplasmatota archaeon]|nr:hypothetical protein [Candidatus Thermoplasmatota archaeon]